MCDQICLPANLLSRFVQRLIVLSRVVDELRNPYVQIRLPVLNKYPELSTPPPKKETILSFVYSVKRMFSFRTGKQIWKIVLNW